MYTRLTRDSVFKILELKVKEFKEMITCSCKRIKIKCGHRNKRWIILVCRTLRICSLSITESSNKVTLVGIAELR